jgi:thiamine biosynthesis protein ThiS
MMKRMVIQVNGEARNVEGPLSVGSLIQQLGMKPDRVAIELNRQIVRRDAWAQTQLREGDRVEIVHFVGGGSD